MKHIAAAARISPGLVYWYFKDKQALFKAGVQVMLDEVLAPLQSYFPGETPAHGATPHDVLTVVALSYLRVADRLPANTLFLVSEVLRSSEMREMLVNAGPGRILPELASYFERQQRLGVLPPFDPVTAAELYLGMVMSQVMMARAVPGIHHTRDHQETARMIATTLLAGLHVYESSES